MEWSLDTGERPLYRRPRPFDAESSLRMALTPKVAFDQIKQRYRVAARLEKTGWIGAAILGAPVLVPVLLGYRLRRRKASKDTSSNRKTPFVSRNRPERPSIDPVREAAIRAEPDSFALVRVIGNDLPPRHAVGQTRTNLRFLLETEPDLPGCRKLWLVNRIADPDEEAAIVALLEAHGQAWRRIPFRISDYARVPLDFSTFPGEQYIHQDGFQNLPDVKRERALLQVHRHRNAYAMHNNGGRNAALAWGVEQAKWVLPFDGNCLMTKEDWTRFRSDVARLDTARYVIVPMLRLRSNDAATAAAEPAAAVEEPQIAFRRDAGARFDEAFPYGRRPKVELLARLDVRGPWDRWSCDHWDPAAGAVLPDSHLVGHAGMVRRLASGRGDLEEEGREALHGRGEARNKGVAAMLRRLDARVIADRGYSETRPAFYDVDALPSLDGRVAHRLRDAAAAAERRGPYAVTDKTDPAPGGDLHDYYHPAPYWWPNPSSADGLPYVQRDGERRPGTVMYEPESDRYDRTRLQRMIDDTVTCALAFRVFGDVGARDRACRLVETWFLDPATAMSPHLRYAQIRAGHGKEGAATGLIEMKDLAYLLDAVRLLDERSLSNGLACWLRPYRDWLVGSPQGRKERRAFNNHGVYYDLQLAAISAFLGDVDILLDCFVASTARLTGHFSADGAQPHELARSQTQHYVAFNLHGWQALEILYRACGLPVEVQPEWSRVGMGVRWALARREGPWPFPQIAPFDADRFAPIALFGEALGQRAEPSTADRATAGTKPRFHPHDGVPPWWPLILPPEALHG